MMLIPLHEVGIMCCLQESRIVEFTAGIYVERIITNMMYTYVL